MPDDATLPPTAVHVLLLDGVHGPANGKHLLVTRHFPYSTIEHREPPNQIEKAGGPAETMDGAILWRDDTIPRRSHGVKIGAGGGQVTGKDGLLLYC